ncbi:DUF6531 domain-containing protein [Streptomyces sp. NRRL S-1868]|uniref:DUF6531 domain-containing protein n=1 Tax=Streptomyces sp. NRRL S-1868 TaxID=1463892 RepID=UPI00068EA8B8|nr:DUF6531 domain-containing protein [Streptomyces sp. NRRL S-1868]
MSFLDATAEKAKAALETVGLKWPDGDPGKLRDAAQAWRDFAEDVDDVIAATNKSAGSIIEINSGEAVDAFEHFWRRYVGKDDTDGWLRNLSRAAKKLAKGLDGVADQIDKEVDRLWTEISISATAIVLAIAFTPATAGASDLLAEGVVGEVLAMGAAAGVNISARAAQIFADAVVLAALGGVESATMDLAVAQSVRIATGHQDGYSLDEVANAAKTGSLTGAVLGPLSRGTFSLERPVALRPSSLRSQLIPPSAARRSKDLPGRGEPVDVAGGDMFMEQTDLSLPGALPLVVSRTHLSSYRAGVCFGPSWASTLDEHVQLDADGVVYAGADGMRLVFPVPEPGVPVLPAKGARWTLEWDGGPDGAMRVTDPHSGLVRTFADPGPTEEDGVICLPLACWEDRNGERVDIERDAGGVPTGLRHSGGYYVTVETENRRVTALRLMDEAPSPYAAASGSSAPGTTVLRYAYDEAGNLAEVVNSTGKALRFTYDSAGRMLTWQDRNGTLFRYEYDTAGRVVATAGPDGIYANRFTYDDAARTTVLTDSYGGRRICRWNTEGQVVEETDPLGHTTRTEWNAHGTAPVTVTEPSGRTTRYAYDAYDNLVSVTHPDGTVTTVEHNALHLPTLIREPGGARWQHTYDEAGNLTATVDPAGATTRYRYTPRGHLTAVIDALGHTRRIVPDPAGLPTAVTDALGHTTHVRRDTFGRITAITDPLGHTTRMAWTVEGRPAWREDATGARETWTWDGEGNLLGHTDAAGHTTTYEPGPFDVPLRRTDPDGATYTFTYDTEMRLTRVTNPQGRHWTYTYDPAGRLTSETDFNGARLTYELDPDGLLLGRTNAAAETLRYTRDTLGRVTAQHDLTTGAVTRFTYDEAGHLTRATTPATDLTFTHDPLGRVLTETTVLFGSPPGGSTPSPAARPTERRTSDAEPSTTVPAEPEATAGSASTAETSPRTVTYAYDVLGRRTHRTTPSGITSTWSYDAEGRPTELATDHGTLTLSHDAAGRETERRTGDLTLTQQWDAADRLTTQTARTPSALAQHRAYTYRPDGHLTEIRELATGTRRFDLTTTGRVHRVSAHGWHETYAYDPAGNLTHAEAPHHPANGERENTGTLQHRAGRTTYLHDAAGRRISTCRRLLDGRRRTWTHTWNAEDQLTRLRTPDGAVWTYTYDALGRRVAKTGPDGHTLTFTWDGTRLAEQTTHEGRTTTWDHAPGTHRPLTQTDHTPLTRIPGQSLLTKLTDPHTTAPRFHAVLTDLTGTPTELLTPTGELTWQHRTTLWGTPLPPPASTEAGDTLTCPLRFPGQYADPESGLHYNYFRYYDPEGGRYLSADPLGLGPAANSVTYVTNPHNWTDPLGLAPCNVTLDSRRLAFNAARERAGVPNSQQPVKQWTVGGDPAQRHRTSNYVYDENPGTHGRYYQYETPEGTRLVVEHTADPHAPHPHFHAGKPKGGGHNIDMRNERYQQVGVKHHIYYKE